MLELLHAFELLHGIAWAIEHPKEFRRRVGVGIRATLVGCAALFGLAALGDLVINAIGLEGTASTNASTVGTAVSLVFAVLAVRWYLRRVRRDSQPAAEGSADVEK